MTLADVKVAAAAAGLSISGAFHPEADDMPAGEHAGTLAMLGFTGKEWSRFAASPEYGDGKPHSLDRWSYRVINELAHRLGARPYFPFTAPLMPFIRWAQKAEPVHPSEIGMMIHPEYGLWRAWRGALAFKEEFDLPPHEGTPSPCDSCVEKPCLSACPVNAMKGAGNYDIAACVTHIRTDAGKDCMSGGCLARRACPIGKDYQYAPEQASFHMKSFRGG